ncbi:MAG: histidine phosphatase family protein [Prolixibacteraceae bacterium]|jgi:phosphohistidine phosphatase|nr:histidine phosphatase family protein [Prolixibacteraceae bacterium]
MKRLAIIRHAKTEQQNYHNDFDRQLLERGRNDAKKIVDDLKEWKIYPQKMISSPAKRAITTAHIYAEELGYSPENIETIEELYFEFTTTDFIELIQKTPDNVDTLFIFGHNPLMHFMAQNMSADFDGQMPTCSTVVLDFDINSWKSIEARKGLLFLHLYPKIYKGEGR